MSSKSKAGFPRGRTRQERADNIIKRTTLNVVPSNLNKKVCANVMRGGRMRTVGTYAKISGDTPVTKAGMAKLVRESIYQGRILNEEESAAILFACALDVA